jgi:hypothetical protein
MANTARAPGGEARRGQHSQGARRGGPPWPTQPGRQAGRPAVANTARAPGGEAAGANAAAPGASGQRPRMASRTRVAVSLGVRPTRTPTFSRASFLAWAVPADPEMIAPACPIVLPSGAVKPAT